MYIVRECGSHTLVYGYLERRCKKMQIFCKKMQIYLHISKKSSTFVADLGIVPFATLIYN